MPSLQKIIFWVFLFFVAWPVLLYVLDVGLGVSIEIDQSLVDHLLIIPILCVLIFVSLKRTINIVKYRRLDPIDIKSIEFHIGGMVKGAQHGVDHFYLVSDWATKNLKLEKLIQKAGNQEVEVDINGLHYSLLIPSLKFLDAKGESLATAQYTKDPKLVSLLIDLKGRELKWVCTHINRA